MTENLIERTARIAFEANNTGERWPAIEGWRRVIWIRQAHLELWLEELSGLVRNWSVGEPV